jgi:phosphopantothenoylcysteine synthetase/decarboxylase
MGARLADEALRRGHQVTIVSGPGTEPFPDRARVIHVERTQEMARALARQAHRADAVLMAAAVSDFQPVSPATRKLQRRGRMTLRLTTTPEIIGSLPRRACQVVVGFALETDDVLARARRKLRTKRLDLVLAQQLSPPKRAAGGANGCGAPPHQRMAGEAKENWWGGAPFGRRRVRAWLLARDGWVRSLGLTTKPMVARALLDKVEGLCYGQSTCGP